MREAIKKGLLSMTLITPETERRTLETDLEQIRSILSDLKVDVEQLTRQARTGEVSKLKEAGKALQELRQWTRMAMEVEKTLDEYARKEAGLGEGYALDLAEAKRTIGCRLARIAPCCQA